MNESKFQQLLGIESGEYNSMHKLMVMEAFLAYHKGHRKQMTKTIQESLRYTSLSTTENILNWAENFKQYPLDSIYKNNRQKIPNIIHFCYGLLPDAPFNLFHYLAIKSAHDLNLPEAIYFFYQYEPRGKWWEKAKPYLTLVQVEAPKEIFGNRLHHFAHQADIIRLEKLNEIGGIYLDMDTISVRPFTDILKYEFVMGVQDSHKQKDDDEFYGMANAIMLGAPNSFFGTTWYSSYKTFRSKGRDQYWDEHSVGVPRKLAQSNPNSIEILGGDTFFFPLWNDIEKILFNEEMTHHFEDLFKNSYCIHLWETFNIDLLNSIDENYINNHNNIYSLLARRHLSGQYERETISFVFLTYNRLEKAKKCLESFIKTLDRDDVLEIIVLDNSSEDGTREYVLELEKKYEKFKVILSDENLGVCHGRIKLFKEAKGDIIASIDSDLILTDESIINKFKAVLRNDQVGMCGIAGAMLKGWEFGTHEDIKDDLFEGEVDLIAGCCQIFKRSLFDLGVQLDPYFYPFWVEDSDFSLQVLNIGKKNYVIPSTGMYHDWGGTGKKWVDLFEIFWNYFADKWRGKGLVSFEKDKAYKFSRLWDRCQHQLSKLESELSR